MTKEKKEETTGKKERGLNRLELTIVEPISRFKLISEDEKEQDFYLSCLTGGTTAANVAVDYCPPVQKVWGEGSDYKALNLAKMWSLVMLSQWFYQLKDENTLDEQREKAFRNSAWTLLSLFEEDPLKPHWPVLMDAEIDIALKLDEQFRYEIDKDDDMAAYAVLLLSWAVQAAGEVVLDWNKVAVPVTDFAQLTEAGAILNNEPFKAAQHLIDILNAEQSGIVAMARFYREMHPAPEQVSQVTARQKEKSEECGCGCTHEHDQTISTKPAAKEVTKDSAAKSTKTINTAAIKNKSIAKSNTGDKPTAAKKTAKTKKEENGK